MDFSVERSGDRTYRRYSSDSDSKLQLLFLPSGLNPELWRHQLKYFSREYRVETFEPEDRHDATSERDIAGDILDGMRNVVLVSHTAGNRLLRRLESREEVVATVASGSYSMSRAPPDSVYRILARAFCSNPKLMKKVFFSPLTDYRVVKEFSKTVETPVREELQSFLELEDRRPVKRSLLIHATSDRFSNREVQEDRDDTYTSILNGAGTFSFFEKPQEFNKALHDFLKNMDSFVERREIFRAKKKNRSLKEFEKSEREKVVL